MDNYFGWNNAQDFIHDQERYQDFNSFQNLNAYQVNSLYSTNSCYAPYPPSIDFSYAFENQCYDPQYNSQGHQGSSSSSSSSLEEMMKQMAANNLQFQNITSQSISNLEKQMSQLAETVNRLAEVNSPTNHDSCFVIDENFVHDESACLVDDCPRLNNDKLDAVENLPNLENTFELNELVDEIKIDECPIKIEKELKIDEIEIFAWVYKDPIWEEFLSRTYNDYSDDFSSYFAFSKSLEHVKNIKIFLYFYGSKVYLHTLFLLLIRRYVHLFAFSPH